MPGAAISLPETMGEQRVAVWAVRACPSLITSLPWQDYGKSGRLAVHATWVCAGRTRFSLRSVSQAHCASGMRGSARCRRSTSRSELTMLPNMPLAFCWRVPIPTWLLDGE